LKLKPDELVSNFAFNFNLRPSTMAGERTPDDYNEHRAATPATAPAAPFGRRTAFASAVMLAASSTLAASAADADFVRDTRVGRASQNYSCLLAVSKRHLFQETRDQN